MKVLLIGPYDPDKGKTSFMAPPLGVWRLCGFLRRHGFDGEVFDPNLHGDASAALRQKVVAFQPHLIGFSLTSLTLPYDLALVYVAKAVYPEALYLGGGIAATFEYETVMTHAPLDYCVLGEGEIPLLAVCRQLEESGEIQPDKVPGLVYRAQCGLVKNSNPCLNYEQFKTATYAIPYEEMPIIRYWEKMLSASSYLCELPALERKVQERDIRTIRLMTMNYCPMGCTFCSYTHFLNSANDGRAVQMVRLQPQDIINMIIKIVRFYPQMETLIFQDDMFIVKGDQRVLSLFAEIVQSKKEGSIPKSLRFIASCRIDCMNTTYLEPMRRAGFGVIGYGIESFSRNVLREYGKEKIYRCIEPVLQATLQAGLKPFLDIILCSPQSTLSDVRHTLEKCLEYIDRGCECAINPTVMPLAGSAMAASARLQRFIRYEQVPIPGTPLCLKRGKSIQPESLQVWEFLSQVESARQKNMADFADKYSYTHFPSRLRALFFILGVVETYPAFLSCSKEAIWDRIYSMAGMYAEKNV